MDRQNRNYSGAIFPFSRLFVILIIACSFIPDVVSFCAPLFQHAKTIPGRSPTTTMYLSDEAQDEPAEKKEPVTDILNSPDFLKRKVDVLKSDIAAAEQAMVEAKERLAAGKEEWGSAIEDLQKEYQIMQKRMNTESNTNDEQAVAIVVRKMLDVLDNYDRAFGAVQPENEEQESITSQYREVYQNMLGVFTEMGVEEVKTVGTEFDYEVHQAVMQRPEEGFEEGIVCAEFAKGFKVGNVLVRAAMVAVAA